MIWAGNPSDLNMLKIKVLPFKLILMKVHTRTICIFQKFSSMWKWFNTEREQSRFSSRDMGVAGRKKGSLIANRLTHGLLRKSSRQQFSNADLSVSLSGVVMNGKTSFLLDIPNGNSRMDFGPISKIFWFYCWKNLIKHVKVVIWVMASLFTT